MQQQSSRIHTIFHNSKLFVFRIFRRNASISLMLYLSLFFGASACSRFSKENPEQSRHINLTDTALIKQYIAGARQWQGEKKFDSAVVYLEKAQALARQLNHNHWQHEVLKEYGNLMAVNENFSPALEYYFRVLKILDEETLAGADSPDLDKRYADICILIGISYFKLESFENALHYYTRCLDLCRKVYSRDSAFPIEMRSMVLYNNIGSVYLTQDKLDSAKYNFGRALEINQKISNQAYEASLCNNMGIISKNFKNYDEAFSYYNKALDIRTKLRDTAGIAQVYNNLGDCYYLVGDYRQAKEALIKALEFSRISNVLTSEIKAANFLSLTYEKAGDYRKSLEYQRLYNSLLDSMNMDEQSNLAARLEVQYNFEKKQRESELLQQIELAKKQRRLLVLMIISGILLFSFIILFLLHRNQKIKLKRNTLIQESLLLERKNLNLEKQNLLLEKQNLELELDFRNKELATHVMYLLKKNEFIASISKKLLELKTSMGTKSNLWLQDIIRQMKSNIDNTVWNDFEVRFQQVHQDFYQKLTEKFPDLSPNERKLCAFMRLNMTTKEISAITFQTVNSIRVARIRLRKKMGMAHEDNLVAFLQEL